jgi:hypothetical protein
VKKIVITILLILALNSCAVAPSGKIQNILIEDGSIKVNMNAEVLYNTLGGSGASGFTWLKVYKQYSHMYITPWTKGNSFDNNYYATEQIVSGKNSKLNNYKVVKIFDDPIEMFDYYLKILPNGKSKNNILKWKASYLSNSSYLIWKNAKKKRTPKTIKNIVKENKKKTKSNLVRD